LSLELENKNYNITCNDEGYSFDLFDSCFEIIKHNKEQKVNLKIENNNDKNNDNNNDNNNDKNKFEKKENDLNQTREENKNT
jgi:hypothetical protein